MSHTVYSVIEFGGQLADKFHHDEGEDSGPRSGVGITKTVSGRGREFWRARLGKRFTGGHVVKRDFSTLTDARKWIFGEAQEKKANPGAGD